MSKEIEQDNNSEALKDELNSLFDNSPKETAPQEAAETKVVETEVETEVETSVDYKSQYETLLDKVAEKEAELQTWISHARKHEDRAKAQKKEMQVSEILTKFSLPKEAKDFLIGDNFEAMESSAEKLKLIFKTGKTEAPQPEKLVVKNNLQGLDGNLKTTKDPLIESLRNAFKK